MVLIPSESVLYVNGYPVNCDNKVTNLIMSVGEMLSFSVAQIIVFEYIVLIFMSDGVADHVTATYCSFKCVANVLILWDIL